MDVANRKPRQNKRLPTVEGLERRSLLATSAGPGVVLVAATTLDSRGVTVTYDVDDAAAGQALRFDVVRSADPRLEPGDVAVGSAQALPPTPGQPAGQAGGTLDDAGRPATDAGRHTVTFALPGGLPPDPKHPFVVVAGETAAAAAQGQGPSTAEFRKYVIGVITHGGKQPKEWSRKGPPWERRMATQLLADGYDAVIPYNWVSQSNHPGAAVYQAPRVAADVVRAASTLPAGNPVDVHFIGHSEGAVVNSEAILRLNASGWPANVKAGYLKVTMLDPHAANNALPNKQYSVSNGPLGAVARMMINDFQSKAKDPLPVVTPNVQSAEVFYQHTPVREAYGSNGGVYNLWGQVPVKGQATYFDLTAPGVSHAGKFGVQDWYRLNVVPTLGGGGSVVAAAAVTGAPTGGATTAPGGRREAVRYAGKAAPGTVVRLYAAPPDQSTVTPVGRARTDRNGAWEVTTRGLLPGRYRVVATSTAPHVRGPWRRPVYLRPTAWLGPLTVSPPAGG